MTSPVQYVASSPVSQTCLTPKFLLSNPYVEYHVTAVHAVTEPSLAGNGQEALWGLSLKLFCNSLGACMTKSGVGLTSVSVQTYWNW